MTAPPSTTVVGERVRQLETLRRPARWRIHGGPVIKASLDRRRQASAAAPLPVASARHRDE